MVHKRVQRAPTNPCKPAFFQPIRSETETSKTAAYARFPALGAGRLLFGLKFWSVHCIVIVYCDWADTITLGLALWLPSLVYAQEWKISGTDTTDIPLHLQKHRMSLSRVNLLIGNITNVKSSISVSPPSCLTFARPYRDPMALRDISNSSTATGVLWEVVSSGASFSL